MPDDETLLIPICIAGLHWCGGLLYDWRIWSNASDCLSQPHRHHVQLAVVFTTVVPKPTHLCSAHLFSDVVRPAWDLTVAFASCGQACSHFQLTHELAAVRLPSGW